MGWDDIELTCTFLDEVGWDGTELNMCFLFNAVECDEMRWS